MRIELAEDNGFMNDGKPTLVVLVITTDDGKQRRIPYEASRTIQELYQDVSRMPVSKDSTGGFSTMLSAPGTREGLVLIAPPDKSVDIIIKNIGQLEIDREDIVKCLRTVTDIDNRVLLEKGKEYRVIEIIKQNGQLIGYEVVDDNADAQRRTPCFADDVQLLKKFVAPPPRLDNETVKKLQAEMTEDQLANLK